VIGRARRVPVAPVVVGVLFAGYAVPLAWIVLTSLKSSAEVFGDGLGLVFTPTLAAYEDALSGDLLDALVQSLIIASGATALTILIAAPTAYGLARVNGVLSSAGLGLLIVLQMTPQTASVIPLFQVLGSWGLLDSTAGVVLADSALMTPFAILLLRPFFRRVPAALEEAAAIDGASPLRTFVSIVLPVARNGVVTTATLVFLITWGEFVYAVNFLLSPGAYPLSAAMAQQVSAYGVDWPGLMALSVITSIPVLVLFALSYRLLKEGLTVGAVK
jgi:multiple sugar transport system permease protein